MPHGYDHELPYTERADGGGGWAGISWRRVLGWRVGPEGLWCEARGPRRAGIVPNDMHRSATGRSHHPILPWYLMVPVGQRGTCNETNLLRYL